MIWKGSVRLEVEALDFEVQSLQQRLQSDRRHAVATVDRELEWLVLTAHAEHVVDVARADIDADRIVPRFDCGASFAISSEIFSISSSPLASPIGIACSRQILNPLYCAGLWLAVTMMPPPAANDSTA